MKREASTAAPGPAAYGAVDTGSPLGRVWVLFQDTPDGGALALRAWSEEPDEAAIASLARELGLPPESVRGPVPLPERFATPLTAFGRGEPIELASVPVEIVGTPFARAVYAALRRVRRGHVRSYAGLAADAGRPRAMRAVGQAMAKNPLPLLVPCHRVVAHEHALGGYTGGVEKKRILLELEGVTIDGERVIPGQLSLLGE